MQVVESTEGSSVLLKCTHRKILLEEKQLTVHWRQNNTRIVYDIIHGKVSIKAQDPAYKNRADVLTEELKKGHVFLRLTDLKLSDGGMYLCFVPALGIQHSTQLVVKERPLIQYAAFQVSSHGTEAKLERTLLLLIPLSGFILHFI
ncbi:programmed cell death 1 ligand 1 isoform X2 [Labeo rohita]|uniref:programmed cell death 1 ligand 1 isoform X2 n=1 Tax=Labeo rohita TaxID=84645 RepID=UPI0021E2AF6F|nr:programmed cell death 1 ligand 1 isoform X2 [Labeo rohita]